MVPYEFDFVDGSNMLSPWGGCEKSGVTDKSAMPGRHTWYNKDFNKLLCDAGAVMGDEAKRNTMYQQAEKILVEDVALVPIYHPIMVAMVKPDIKGADVRARTRTAGHLGTASASPAASR